MCGSGAGRQKIIQNMMPEWKDCMVRADNRRKAYKIRQARGKSCRVKARNGCGTYKLVAERGEARKGIGKNGRRAHTTQSKQRSGVGFSEKI